MIAHPPLGENMILIDRKDLKDSDTIGVVELARMLKVERRLLTYHCRKDHIPNTICINAINRKCAEYRWLRSDAVRIKHFGKGVFVIMN